MSVMQRISSPDFPWLTLTLAGSMVALFAALGPAPEAWVYDRLAIAAGEWWRLFSGHWVHSDGGHLGWNLAATLLLGWIVERWNRSFLLLGLLTGSLAVDLMLWLGLPGLSHYCGLSGVLNTLLLVALIALRRDTRGGILLMIGVLSLGKILVELLAGQALFTHTAWASVPEAHLGGWLIGLLMIAAGRAIKWTPGAIE